MNPAERIDNLLNRLSSYSPWQVLVEIGVVWIVLYLISRFVRGTRAAGALRGLVLLFVVVLGTLVVARVAFGGESLPRLSYVYHRFLAILAVALVVIFQPELRQAMIRMGETRFFRSSPSEIMALVSAVVDACAYFSKAKFGAIIVIERSVGLQHLVDRGTPLGAQVSARLLQTIFFPGTALHDLAVLIRGNVVQSAGVQLPMVDETQVPDPVLGARHRAALGLTSECDALVVVVSEETGGIRLSERGKLSQPMSVERLRQELLRRLRQDPPAKGMTEEQRKLDTDSSVTDDDSVDIADAKSEKAKPRKSSTAVKKKSETKAPTS